jgi:hypothetical protein
VFVQVRQPSPNGKRCYRALSEAPSNGIKRTIDFVFAGVEIGERLITNNIRWLLFDGRLESFKGLISESGRQLHRTNKYLRLGIN